MVIFNIICFIIICNIEAIFAEKNEYCLTKDKHPFVYFGSKTDYEFVRGNLETVEIESECKPIQFWSLNRHGTRFTKHHETQFLQQARRLKKLLARNIENGRKPELCPQDLKKILEWEYDGKIEKKESELTEQGFVESTNLAKRFKKKYPKLLENYSKEDFYFKHTDEKRTQSTFKAYTEGLFGKEIQVESDFPSNEDTVIRSYDACPAWKIKVARNRTFTEKEQNIFKTQPEYLKLLKDVSKRLGFADNLKSDDIQIMYNVCRFEKSWNPQNLSPWCSVFTKQEFEILNYLDDLSQYYQNSFGHPIHHKLGCRPLTDMMKRFSQTISSGEARPKAVALFTHHTMLNMVLVRLNYGNDGVALKGSNYEDLMRKRKYLSSINMPFGANIVAVLHRCPDTKHAVQFYLNERPMELEGCPSGLCSWENLNKLLPNIKECNLNFCYDLK